MLIDSDDINDDLQLEVYDNNSISEDDNESNSSFDSSTIDEDSISDDLNIDEDSISDDLNYDNSKPLHIDVPEECKLNVIETLRNRRKRQNENIQLATSTIIKKSRVVSSLQVNAEMVKYLCENKFADYLSQKLHKKHKTISEIAKRLSQYLYHVNPNFNSTNETYHQKLMNAISVTTSITAYLDYCMEEDGYQPCSLTIRLDDISNFIHYVELYEPKLPTNFFNARGTIKTYRTSLRKMQTHKDKSTKNPDEIIKSRKFPIGGLKELQSLLNSDLNYFSYWCENSQSNFPSQTVYKYLLGFVLASLWVFSPNARAGAVEDITLVEAKELINSLSIGSTKFKSSTKHKIQPLILQDEKAVGILRNYIDHLRPVSDNLQCLLRYKGTPFTQGTISEYIRSYFQKMGGYNITVTTLRRVLCSEVFRATVDGTVTESARKQFNYIQGHSDRCNYAVYVKLALKTNSDIARDTFSKLGLTTTSATSLSPPSRPPSSQLPTTVDENLLDTDHPLQTNADIARDTFSKLGLTTTSATSLSPSSQLSELTDDIVVERRNNSTLDSSKPNRSSGILPWPKDYLTCYDDWGIAHSCRKKTANRITWDEREKQWIKNYMEMWGHEMDPKIDRHKQLLQAIIDDPNARPLFHPNHVSIYLRLREAMRDRN
jgi:hypothetical protein